jgi:predicted TIM-barrel fold metal-dependent hydrolase
VTIDAHVHLFDRGFLPRKWFESVARRWAGTTFPPRDASGLDVEGGLCDPGGRLLFADMDAADVDAAVCLSLDWDIGLGAAPVPRAEVHRLYGALQRENPGRFFAVAAVDPRRQDAVRLLEQALDEDGLIGLKLYPPRGYAPGDEVCSPLVQACIDRDLPVVIHTAHVGWPHQGRLGNPLLVDALQVRHPEATIVLAHAGHPLWLEECLLVTAAHPTTFAELSNWNELIEHEPDLYVRHVCRARDVVGPHRIIFGSDQLGGRRFTGERSPMRRTVEFAHDLPARARRLGLEFSEDDLDLFLDGNARRAFRLERHGPANPGADGSSVRTTGS